MLYELTVDQEHINLIKKALQSYLCSIYDALDEEVLNVDKAHEDIKVLSDMLAVLKGQNGYRQTSESVGLMWSKQINLEEQYQKESNSFAEYSEMCLDTFLKNHHKEDSINPSKAWNNVKERHWDTIKRTGEK